MLEALTIFAVWRITSLLYAEQGPFGIFAIFRKFARRFTRLFQCFWCVSIWVAIPFAVYAGWNDVPHILIYWLGYSGASIIIHQIIESLDVRKL